MESSSGEPEIDTNTEKSKAASAAFFISPLNDNPYSIYFTTPTATPNWPRGRGWELRQQYQRLEEP